MGKLYLIGNGIIKKDGKPISTYEFNKDEELIFEFTPFIGKKANLAPYAVTVGITDNEPVIESALIMPVKWYDDYELRFLPFEIDAYKPPQAITQQSVYTPEGDITVTVYQDSRTRVSVEGTGIFYIHTPLSDLTDAEVKMSNSSDTTIAVITGKAEELNYLLILMINKTCRVLYENIADKIIYNRNNLKITRKLEDMKGRILHQTLTYNGSAYSEIERSYECAYEHTIRPELVPYALLDAMQAGDLKDAASYLDKNLSAENLKAFFGEIYEISEPKYTEHKDNEVAVIIREDRGLKAVIYKFIIENGLITNIIERE